MPLVTRVPRNPTVLAESGPYRRALDVLDGRSTAVQRQLRRGGLAGYEQATRATLLALVEQVPRPAAFFDVGAHIGLYSALVSTVFGASGVRAVAFEPTPETLGRCRRLTARNGLDVDTVGVALSDTDGMATLYLSDKSEASNSLIRGFKRSSREVRVRTRKLDDYSADCGVYPAVVKIDVETYEAHTLRGALGTFERHRPWVVCELLPKSDPEQLDAVLERIAALGYRLYPIHAQARWAACGIGEYRARLSSEQRDWLLAPEPLDDAFYVAFGRWMDAIAECGPDTNLLLPDDAVLRSDWAAPYDPAEVAIPAPTVSRNAAPVRAPRAPLPTVLGRMRWRLPYRIANRLERAAFAPRGADSTVVRVRGRLRHVLVRPKVAAGVVGDRNLRLVSEICERAGIGYLLTYRSATGRHRVAVESTEWSRFVTELASTARQRPVYAAIGARNRRGRSVAWTELANDPTLRTALAEQRAVDVFEYVMTGTAARVAGPTRACRVERWLRDGNGGLAAPGTHPRGAYLSLTYQQSARIEVGGRELPTFEPLTRPNVGDVDFPVDAVYLWVDGSDRAWQGRQRRLLDEHGAVDPVSVSAARFRDNGELRYSLRSLEQYAPWIRLVYLVTDDQVPEWLDVDHDRLRLVSHRELFGDEGAYPSFNSHALGARLHHLDGLAEHYLYLNDDVLFGRPVPPTAFFHANGLTKFFLSRATLPWSDPATMPPHEAARRNAVELLERDFGRTATRAFFHTPIPQRKGVLEELEKRYPDVFTLTWNSRFRSRDDYEVNSWLHHYYGFLTGQAVPGSIGYAYFTPSEQRSWRQMRRLLRTRDRDVFCVNDDDGGDEAWSNRLASWLEAYLPAPSSFER